MPPEDDPTTPPTTDPVTPPEGQEPPPAAPAMEPPAPTVPPAGPDGITDLPDWAQKEIKRLREEAGRDRTAAKEKAASEARASAEAEAKAKLDEAQTAHAEQMKQIAKLLGYEKDDTQLTPEQVIEQVTKERDAEKAARETRDKEFRALALEVAVQDAAAMHDAKSDRLLDSRAFMRTVRTLDPSSEGYRVAVAEAVKTAVEADGALKATPKVTPPAVSGGTAVAGKPTKRPEDMTVDEMKALLFPKR